MLVGLPIATSVPNPNPNRTPHWKALRLLPNETSVQVAAWVDKSIIEVFGQSGRAAVTARVYPTLRDSHGVGLYTRGNESAELQSLSAWQMRGVSVAPAAAAREPE